MTVVIPIAGKQKRFVAAGYTYPVPLLKIDGKQGLASVIASFPGEKNLIFICNMDHIKNSNLADVIQTTRKDSKVVMSQPQEQGPVQSIKHAYHFIPDDQEVFVSHGNISAQWDIPEFKKTAQTNNADAAIMVCKGYNPYHDATAQVHFHKKTLHLSEKETAETESAQFIGLFWFKDGSVLKKYFDHLLSSNAAPGHEFTVINAFSSMLHDHKKVLVFPVKQYMQWTSPEEMEEYEAWSRSFALLCGKLDAKPKTEILPAREPHVKARMALKKDHPQTFQYWHNYFVNASWHPYGKETK